MQPEWCVKLSFVLAHILINLIGTSEGLNYLACFKEKSISDRLLKGARKEFRRTLTPEICLSYCKTKGMRYFGLQYSYECFCSVDRPNFKSITNEDECDMKCEGNPRETCGGGLRLSVYDSEVDLSTAKYVGCYRERSVTARLMSGANQEFRGSLTNKKCIEFCRGKGFTYAGTQYSVECFCSNERPYFKSFADEDDCNAKCDGDENEKCGGGFRLSVYDLYDKRADQVFSNFVGCYEISPYQNDLLPNHKEYFEKKLTPEFCVGYCYRRGYRYAGMKSGSSCYCGNTVDGNSKVNDAQCSSPCSGDNKLNCGGDEKMSIYHTEISDQSEEGRLLGCFEDSDSRRTLSGHMSEFKETLTPRLCLNVCLQLGFKYSGVEAGYECHCGSRPPSTDLEKPENECLMYCPGDRLKMCGGGWRLLVFSTGSGTSSPKPVPARPLTPRTTTTTTTTRRPLTQETSPDTVRPVSSSQPQTTLPVPSSKPQIVRPGSNRPVAPSTPTKPSKPTQTASSTQAKPSEPTQPSSKPTQTTRPSSSSKPLSNQIKPQPSPTTRKPQTQPGTTSRPISQTSAPSQQQTSWGGQTQQQPSWGSTTQQQQQPQTTWEAQQQNTWATKPSQQANPQQQTTLGSNPHQQTTFGSNNQQQTTLGSNQPQQTTFGSNPDQQTTFGSNPPQRPQATLPPNPAQPTNWQNTKPFTQQGSDSVIRPPKPAENQPGYLIGGTTLSVDGVTGRPNCFRSVTEVKGGNACRGELLFYDDFSGGTRINEFKWTHEVIMPWTPDYEFVVYRKSQQNSFLKNRKLVIKPTIFDDDFVKRGLLELDSCTGLLHSEECRRQGASYNIIPPVESARLTTKDTFSFKYGKIEIRAKLPIGDWIVPEIWLEPKRKEYGTGAYASGRVRIAMARGNANLEFDGRDIGNKQLEVGILMGVGTAENIRARTIIRDKTDGWYRSFHNYTLIWTPDNLQFLVDGQHQESLVSGGQPLYQLAGFDEELGATWKHGSLIAPFDKEFYITLGLSVGGMRDFPDECRSSGREKPWRNMAVKAMASFWEDRRYWKSTWDDENSSLQVEHVIVTAL